MYGLKKRLQIGAAGKNGQCRTTSDFGSIVLKQNPFTLSGTVKNPSGTAILGVNVQLLQNN